MDPVTLIFFKIHLAILSCLHFYMNFRISLSVVCFVCVFFLFVCLFSKKAAEIIIGITKCVDQFGGIAIIILNF